MTRYRENSGIEHPNMIGQACRKHCATPGLLSLSLMWCTPAKSHTILIVDPNMALGTQAGSTAAKPTRTPACRLRARPTQRRFRRSPGVRLNPRRSRAKGRQPKRNQKRTRIAKTKTKNGWRFQFSWMWSRAACTVYLATIYLATTYTGQLSTVRPRLCVGDQPHNHTAHTVALLPRASVCFLHVFCFCVSCVCGH